MRNQFFTDMKIAKIILFFTLTIFIGCKDNDDQVYFPEPTEVEEEEEEKEEEEEESSLILPVEINYLSSSTNTSFYRNYRFKGDYLVSEVKGTEGASYKMSSKSYVFEKDHQNFGDVIKSSELKLGMYTVNTAYNYEVSKGVVSKEITENLSGGVEPIATKFRREYVYKGNQLVVSSYDSENKKTREITFTGSENPSKVEVYIAAKKGSGSYEAQTVSIKYNTDPKAKAPFHNVKGWSLAWLSDEVVDYVESTVNLEDFVFYGLYDKSKSLIDEIHVKPLNTGVMDYSYKISSQYELNENGFPIKETRKRTLLRDGSFYSTYITYTYNK